MKIRVLSVLFFLFGGTVLAQGEFKQLQPLEYVLISDIKTDSKTIIKNIKKSMNISLISEYFVELDSNEWGYRLGPFKLDIDGAGYDSRGLPLMYKDDHYITGTIAFKSDKYRVEISSFQNSGALRVYDPSTFLKEPKRRENPNRTKYPEILNYTLINIFQQLDSSEEDW